jgi:hypothetical protein
VARLNDTMGQADRAGRMACPAPWHSHRERERERDADVHGEVFRPKGIRAVRYGG